MPTTQSTGLRDGRHKDLAPPAPRPPHQGRHSRSFFMPFVGQGFILALAVCISLALFGCMLHTDPITPHPSAKEMEMANKADGLRYAVASAKERLAKIGRPETHLQGGVGRLSSVLLVTEVCHQESPSAKNYWKDEAFDFALAKVIGSKFRSLADEAIALMQREADKALVEEEKELRERLARIEQIKSLGEPA